MFHRILVPLDGSHRAEAAIPVAARLARVTRGTVVLMRSIEPLTPYGPYLSGASGPATAMSSPERDSMMSYLTQAAANEALAGVQTITRVTEGSAAHSILDLSQAERIDLIALCAHGVSGYHHWKLGGVAQHVVRHAGCPVLLLSESAVDARPGAGEDQLVDVRRALIPLDGSLVAEAAIPAAVELMAALAPRGGTLHLLQVINPFTARELGVQEAELVQPASEYLTHTAQELQATPTEHLQLTVTTSVMVDTDAAERIIAVADPAYQEGAEAQAPGYDIIVMATHGRTGMLHWALGSITERVVQASKLPLLIVRPVAALATTVGAQQTSVAKS